MPWLCNIYIGLAIRNDFELVLGLKFCDFMFSSCQFLVVVRRLLGASDIVIRYCILCQMVLFMFSVVSSFSQVYLLQWGFAFKFLLNILSDRSLFRARSCWGVV